MPGKPNQYYSLEQSQNELAKSKKNLQDILAGRAATASTQIGIAGNRANEVEQRARDEEMATSTNWLAPTATGASLGTAISPGYGTAIGAGAGALLGLYGGAKKRIEEAKKQGKNMGWLEALQAEVTNTPQYATRPEVIGQLPGLAMMFAMKSGGSSQQGTTVDSSKYTGFNGSGSEYGNLGNYGQQLKLKP